MIFWHKDLVRVLPRRQLLQLLRDCIRLISYKNQYGEVIASDVSNQFNLSMTEVNDYDIDDVLAYTKLVCDEIHKRLYKISERTLIKLRNLYTLNALLSTNPEKYLAIPYGEIFSGWHNIEYLQRCYCILNEMYKREVYSAGDLEKAQKVLISAITQEGVQINV